MARTLPRTPRNRRTALRSAAVLATAVLAAGPMLSGAQADDLRHKNWHAHQNVESAQADLEDSSAALTKAWKRVRAAKAKLASARSALAKIEGELTAARVLDAQMQAKLTAAEAALAKAQSDLVRATAKVHSQRADIGRLAAETYQLGDPRMLRYAAITRAQDPDDLMTQFATIDNLMDKQTSLLEQLKAAQALVEAQKKKVAAYQGQIAAQRQAAAVNLERKKALEKSAADYSQQVAALLTDQRHAAAWAQRMRANDARKLARSKRHEAWIKSLILARARKQHGGYRGGGKGFLLRPVANSYVTSPYGWRRHPIYGYWGLHNGDDFHAPCGVPLRASATGTVIQEYYSDVWGNRLYLDVGKFNGKAMTLIYNHISSYRAHTGQTVQRGDTVAYAGTTGWSTGCHLHFTVMLNGTPVDPMQFF